MKLASIDIGLSGRPKVAWPGQVEGKLLYLGLPHIEECQSLVDHLISDHGITHVRPVGVGKAPLLNRVTMLPRPADLVQDETSCQNLAALALGGERPESGYSLAVSLGSGFSFRLINNAGQEVLSFWGEPSGGEEFYYNVSRDPEVLTQVCGEQPSGVPLQILMEEINPAERGKPTGKFPAVYFARGAGTADAGRIAATYLASLASRVIVGAGVRLKAAGFRVKDVYLFGGVLRHYPYMCTLLTEGFKTIGLQARCVQPFEFVTAHGAWLMANSKE